MNKKDVYKRQAVSHALPEVHKDEDADPRAWFAVPHNRVAAEKADHLVDNPEVGT